MKSYEDCEERRLLLRLAKTGIEWADQGDRTKWTTAKSKSHWDAVKAYQKVRDSKGELTEHGDGRRLDLESIIEAGRHFDRKQRLERINAKFERLFLLEAHRELPEPLVSLLEDIVKELTSR